MPKRALAPVKPWTPPAPLLPIGAPSVFPGPGAPAYIIEARAEGLHTVYVERRMQDGTILHTEYRSRASVYKTEKAAQAVAAAGNAKKSRRHYIVVNKES